MKTGKKGRGISGIQGLAALGVPLSVLLAATQASAALEITSATSTTYTYGFAQQAGDVAGGGDINSLQLAPSSPAHIGRVAIDTVSTVDKDAFYFKLNSYCVGLCATSINSETVLSLFNSSTTETLDGLRFDSQITPGHLARTGSDALTYAAFIFKVTMERDGINFGSIYGALGQVDINGARLEIDDGSSFNGFHAEKNGNTVYADWGATNIFLDLASIGPEETLVLRYTSYLVLDAGTNEIGPCFDISQCAGAQVAFGDPRRSGGVNFSAFGIFGLEAFGTQEDASIIGREFDAFGVPVSINKVGDPTPPSPTPPIPPIYSSVLPASLGSPSAVPEPASWAMMTAAFGLVGAAMRRRLAAPMRAA